MEGTDIKMSDNNKSRVSDSPNTMTSCNSLKETYSVTEEDDMAANTFSIRDRCWLCQRVRKDDHEENTENEDCSSKSRDGALHEFLPWLCKTCEKTIEEEERKAEPGTSLPPSLAELDDNAVYESFSGNTCTCETCSKARESEKEQAQLTSQLERCWKSLQSFLSSIYHVDSSPADGNGLNNVDETKELVSMLCTQDADLLYQRLETLVREVVIEMKVKLLKELTVDQKAIHRAHQFLNLLLLEYTRLCAASQQAATFLTVFEEQYLGQFNLTWIHHNKHLFDSVIYSDPVVQNCLPKVVGHIRSTLSSENDSELGVLYNKTLTEYMKLDKEMSVVSAVWKDCKRLIERYNEQQAALRLKQKMFKEDWAFFKAQRRLLEQAVPQSRTSLSRCCFDVQFNDLMKNILQGKKSTGDYRCSLCNQVRCPCDECNISHMITCGLISPEVSEELAATHQCRYQQRKQQEQMSSSVSSKSENNGQGTPGCLPSPTSLSQISSFSYDPMRYLVNVKPPSMPSSGSSSRSESPLMLDHYRFMLPFGDNFEMPEDIGSEEDTDYMDVHRSRRRSASKLNEQKRSVSPEKDRNENGCRQAMASDMDVHNAPDDSSVLKEVRPSSLVARMMMASVNLSTDKTTCTCPHCMLNNGTSCMFESARRNIAEQKPAAVDRLQLSQLGMARRLLNPQLYELHDDESDASAGSIPGTDQSPSRDGLDCSKSLSDSSGTSVLVRGDQVGVLDVAVERCQVMSSSGDSCRLHGAAPPKNKEETVCTKRQDGHDSERKTKCQDEKLDTTDISIRKMFLKGDAVPSLVSPVAFEPTARGSKSDSSVISIVQVVQDAASSGSPTPVKNTLASGKTQQNTSTGTGSQRVAVQEVLARVTGVVASTSKKCEGQGTPDQIKAASPVAGKSLPCKLQLNATKVPGSGTSLPSSTSSKPGLCTKFDSGAVGSATCKHAAGTTVSSVPNGASSKSTTSETSSHSKCSASHGSGMSHCKDSTPPTTQCCGGKHPVDLSSSVCGSSECSADGGRNSANGGGQKDGGKFCECWHCEFFGHTLPTTLPSSRNYAEIRDRLRQRLQKKKASKTPCAAGVGVAAATVSCQSSSPLGSPRSADVLSDKELEEIIRFINGVDSAMAASVSTVNATTTKQKLVKQKQKKTVRDGAVPRKEDVGHGDITSESPVTAGGVSSNQLPKKTRHDAASSPGKPCNADLAAQLSTRLAQLMDAAAASRNTDQFRRCANDQRETTPRRCKKDSSGSGGIRPHSMDVTLESTLSVGSRPIDPDINSKSSSSSSTSGRGGKQDTVGVIVGAAQSPGTPSIACKSKRQKQQQKLDEASSFDDIFLPSDETGRHESADDFDREIEEFKRFCHNSSLLGGNRERPRVSLNLKDIFVRKKSHQGCA